MAPFITLYNTSIVGLSSNTIGWEKFYGNINKVPLMSKQVMDIVRWGKRGVGGTNFWLIESGWRIRQVKFFWELWRLVREGKFVASKKNWKKKEIDW